MGKTEEEAMGKGGGEKVGRIGLDNPYLSRVTNN